LLAAAGCLAAGNRLFQPIRPYCWQFDSFLDAATIGTSPLVEIPITTMPLLRAPIHG